MFVFVFSRFYSDPHPMYGWIKEKQEIKTVFCDLPFYVTQTERDFGIVCNSIHNLLSALHIIEKRE